MFKSKTTTQAVQPILAVIRNLSQVVEVQRGRKVSAENELISAREHFATVENDKTEQMRAADTEAVRAAKLLVKLEQLLADD